MGAPTADELSLTRRRYRPLLELGRGGMARVYLAESLASGVRKLVVLKILNRDLAADPNMRQAFLREAELSAQLNHPNTVQVYEVVEYSGVPVIVMEFLDGVALSRVTQQIGLPMRLHLHILAQVLLGLHHFHELRDYEGNELHAVHRDVSPQNVLVLHDGPVKVVDFGIAKANSAANDQHTRTGLIKGKIHYMPPEQLLGESDIDRRADIFAVGVMLWEAVAGKRMWEGQTEARVVRNLSQGELPKIRDAVPDVSEDLERILERSLAPARDQRYATAQEMHHDLEQALLKSGGYVRTRELTDFMLAHFGDRRQFQQRSIERALRNPDVSLSTVMECVTPTEHQSGAVIFAPNASGAFGAAREGAPVSSSSPNLSVDSGGPVTLPASRRQWQWKAVTAIALAVGAAGAWLAVNDRSTGSPTPAPTASTLRLRVTPDPASAEIFLDGERLGTGAVERTLARRDGNATVEVRAAGHVDERREVRLDQDVAIDVKLTRAEPAAAHGGAALSATTTAASVSETETDDRSAPSGAKARQRLRTRATTAPVAAKQPAPRPSAVSSARPANASCNPPYKLSPDGVKTYKPECF